MSQNLSTVLCPNCGSEIPVEELFRNQAEAEYQEKLKLEKQEFQNSLIDQKNKFEKEKEKDAQILKLQLEEIKKREQSLIETAQNIENQKQSIQETVQKQLVIEKESILLDFRKRFDEEKQKLESEKTEALLKSASEVEKLKAYKQELDKKATETSQKLNELELEKSKMEDTVNERVKAEKLAQEIRIKKQLNDENQEMLRAHEAQVMDLTKQVAEKNALNSQISQLKMEKELMASKIESELKAKQLEEVKALEIEITKRINDQAKFREAELKLKIESLENQAHEMKVTAQMGSQQTQGEVLELDVEKTLKSEFIFDLINPIKKGANGADITQLVRDKFGNDVGIILYECKRTKGWGKDWTNKIKEDGKLEKANILVIISETLPDELKEQGMGIIDGVYITNITNYKALSIVLRDSMLKINAAMVSQDNKESKAIEMYDYLSGDEFMNSIRSIIKTFDELKKGYEAEKSFMLRTWKKREKQLEIILKSQSNFIGNITGIIGDKSKVTTQIESAFTEIEEMEQDIL